MLSKIHLELVTILKTAKGIANYLCLEFSHYCIKLRFTEYYTSKLNFSVPQKFFTGLHFILTSLGSFISDDTNIYIYIYKVF